MVLNTSPFRKCSMADTSVLCKHGKRWVSAYLHVPQRSEVLHAVKMRLDNVEVSGLLRTTQLQDQLQIRGQQRKRKKK